MEEMKIQKVKCSTIKGSLTKVFAYGQSEPLDVIGVVKADVETVPKVNNLSTVKSYVTGGKGVPLLRGRNRYLFKSFESWVGSECNDKKPHCKTIS
jgi:hypothetical protein